jgi:hypothetical protein
LSHQCLVHSIETGNFCSTLALEKFTLLFDLPVYIKNKLLILTMLVDILSCVITQHIICPFCLKCILGMYTWFYSTDADVLYYWLCKTTLVWTWNYVRTLINDKNPDFMGVIVCQTKGNLRFPTRMKKLKTESLTSSAVVTSQTLYYLPDSQSLNL